MRIFLESANINEVKAVNEIGLLDGVITSSELLADQSSSYEQFLNDLFQFSGIAVCIDAAVTNYQEIINQAKRLNSLSRQVIIKIPCTMDGLKAANALKEEKIAVCVTHVFSLAQAALAAKTNAQYISCSMNPIEVISERQSEELLAQIRTSYEETDSKTQIIAADIKSVDQFEDAFAMGVEVAGIPFYVFEKLIKHGSADKELQKSIDGWQKSGLQLPK